jgi:Helix-turn-helix domain
MNAVTSVQPSLFHACNSARIRNQGFLIAVHREYQRLTRNRFGYCWASNEYLAKALGCSVDSVSRGTARLQALGALAIEHVVGVERRVRVLISMEELKARLFRGHPSHWRESAEPTRKPASCPSSPKGSAAPVAEGQYKESRRDSLQTSPTERGQQHTPKAQAAYRAPDSVVVSILKELGLTLPEALRLAQRVATDNGDIDKVRRAASNVEAVKAKGAARSLAALFWSAFKEGWAPALPPSNHPSDSNGGRKVRDVTHDPGYWEYRRAVEAQEKAEVQKGTTSSPASSMASPGSIPCEMPAVKRSLTDQAAPHLDAPGSARCTPAPQSSAVGVLAGQVLKAAQGAGYGGLSGIAATPIRTTLSLALGEVLQVTSPRGRAPERSLGPGDKSKIERIIAARRAQAKGTG